MHRSNGALALHEMNRAIRHETRDLALENLNKCPNDGKSTRKRTTFLGERGWHNGDLASRKMFRKSVLIDETFLIKPSRFWLFN